MNYEPLQIDIKLSTPLCMGYAWINLDGIIAYLCAREQLGQDFYLLPTKNPVKLNLDVPLKKTGKIYHGSVVLMDVDKISIMRIYKRFDEQNIGHLNTKRKKIPIGCGFFKSCIINLPYIPASEVTFYACGDEDRITELFKGLTGLGKSANIGFGKIIDISIKKIKTDYSLVKDGVSMRPIPISMLRKYESTFYTACTFPYWDKRNVVKCATPGTCVEMV